MTAPLLLVRLRPGVVGESRRVVHVVPLVRGTIADMLTAYCGAIIEPGTAELLDGLTGMPCELCFLSATSATSGVEFHVGKPVRHNVPPGQVRHPLN